jgi:hypothetical protein
VVVNVPPTICFTWPECRSIQGRNFVMLSRLGKVVGVRLRNEVNVGEGGEREQNVGLPKFSF